MFTLRIEYLTGRSVATSYNDRNLAEWPPHPARIFSALVATWADDPSANANERAALDWLSEQAPPAIAASGCSHRTVATHFVPVNDVSVLSTFDSKAAKLTALRDSLAAADLSLREAGRSREAKQIAAVTRQMEKIRKSIEKERSSLQAQQRRDQESDGDHAAASVENARAILVETRLRQARTFPSVTPHDPVIYLTWPVSPDSRIRGALADLASRVIRIGHSSSLVLCRVVEDPPAPTLVPNEEGDTVIRVPGPNHMERLIDAFDRHGEIEPRVLPARYARYSAPAQTRLEIPRSVFDDAWIVFRQIGGRRLFMTRTADMAKTFRAALMSYCDGEPPELLSGHVGDGAPSESPHAAFVPLPFVGHLHATGALLGIALVIPREAAVVERTSVLRAIARWEEAARKAVDQPDLESPPLELRLGEAGMIYMERITWGEAPLANLRPSIWCGPSRIWISATPVALDRNPGDLFSSDTRSSAAAHDAAGQIIATSCERIGLPRPSRVEVISSVPIAGAAKARAYPPYPADPSKTRRVKVHAVVEFDMPVHGPILLGAGRYHGLGLFRPYVGADGAAS